MEKIKTTHQQMELLEIMLGRHKTLVNSVEINEVWNKVTKILNKHGPPHKSTEQWKRVWASRKSTMKRKDNEKFQNQHLLRSISAMQNEMIEQFQLSNDNKNNTMEKSIEPSNIGIIALDEEELPSSSKNVQNIETDQQRAPSRNDVEQALQVWDMLKKIQELLNEKQEKENEIQVIDKQIENLRELIDSLTSLNA